MYEAFLAPSPYPNHGQRVTVGRRFIQSATDIFVGWTSAAGIDFYVRQFRDMKVIPSGEQVTPWLRQFAHKCGLVLARAHATTGDAAAIDAYLGKGRSLRLRHGRVRSGLRRAEPARPRPARRRHTRRRDRQRTRLVTPSSRLSEVVSLAASTGVTRRHSRDRGTWRCRRHGRVGVDTIVGRR